MVDRQHKDAVTRRAFKKLFALLERGLDAVFIAPNVSRMSRAHLYREVKSRFPGVRVVVVLVHVPLADILKRSSGVSASLVRDEYLALQIPRVGVDCDTFSVQAPEFSAYLPEVNQSYLAPHNSPYHVESIAEHVALTVHNARKEPSLRDCVSTNLRAFINSRRKASVGSLISSDRAKDELAAILYAHHAVCTAVRTTAVSRESH